MDNGNEWHMACPTQSLKTRRLPASDGNDDSGQPYEVMSKVLTTTAAKVMSEKKNYKVGDQTALIHPVMMMYDAYDAYDAADADDAVDAVDARATYATTDAYDVHDAHDGIDAQNAHSTNDTDNGI